MLRDAKFTDHWGLTIVATKGGVLRICGGPHLLSPKDAKYFAAAIIEAADWASEPREAPDAN